jgi:hypothetical protein
MIWPVNCHYDPITSLASCHPAEGTTLNFVRRDDTTVKSGRNDIEQVPKTKHATFYKSQAIN